MAGKAYSKSESDNVHSCMFIFSIQNHSGVTSEGWTLPMSDGPIYLDCAATTRVDPRVVTVATAAMLEEFGNAGSRTHQFGSRAKALVDEARSRSHWQWGARQAT